MVAKCSTPSISNGRVSLEGSSVGDVLVYSCKDGYILSGSKERVCSPNAVWSGFEPECLSGK